MQSAFCLLREIQNTLLEEDGILASNLAVQADPNDSLR